MLHVIYFLNEAAYTVDVLLGEYVSLYSQIPPGCEEEEIVQNVHDIYQNLFDSTASINVQYVAEKLGTAGVLPLDKILAAKDVDHYNLLEKAVIYNNVALVRHLLDLEGGGRKCGLTNSTQNLKGGIHLAAVLGAADVVSLMVERNASIVNVSDRIRIGHVMGPAKGNLLVANGYQLTGWPQLSDKTVFRKHWLAEHSEVPAVLAVIGDHADIMKMLMAAHQRVGGACHQEDIVERLLTVASLCESYWCLSVLVHDQTYRGFHVRNKENLLALSSGFRHGLDFFNFLSDHGFPLWRLNRLNCNSSVNALHVYYKGIAKEDAIFSKYKHIYMTTKWLISNGVNVNQLSNHCTSNGLKDTPLHLLIDLLNLPITSYSSSSLTHWPHFQQLQHHFDKSVYHSARLIIEAGFDMGKHINTLLLRLMTNRHHVRRFKLGKRTGHLSARSYGIENVFSMAKLLLNTGAELQPTKRQYTPVLALMDWIATEEGFHCVLGERSNFVAFHAILTLLLMHGMSPVHYPLLPNIESIASAPIIHVMDLVVQQWTSPNTPEVADDYIQNVQHLIQTFIDHGAKYKCTFNANGKYLSHGIFDFIIPLYRSVLRESSLKKVVTKLKLVYRMTHQLLLHGVEPKVCNFAQHRSILYVPQQVRHYILYQTLNLATSLLFREDLLTSPADGDLEDVLYELLSELYLVTPEPFSHACINFVHQITVISHHECDSSKDLATAVSRFDHQLNIWSNEVKSLKQIAKITIRKCLGRNFSVSVGKLPVPLLIKRYLVDLGH